MSISYTTLLGIFMQKSVFEFLQTHKPKSVGLGIYHGVRAGTARVGVYSYFKIAEEFEVKNICDGIKQLKRLCLEYESEINKYKFKTRADKRSCTGVIKFLSKDDTRKGFFLASLEKLLVVLTEISGETFDMKF